VSRHAQVYNRSHLSSRKQCSWASRNHAARWEAL